MNVTRWSRFLVVCFVVTGCLGLAMQAHAVKVKEPTVDLDLIAFANPQLRIVESAVDADSLRGQAPNQDAIDAFQARYGEAWRVLLDERRGVPSMLEGGAIPFVPGYANSLAAERFGAACREAGCIPVQEVERVARAFLDANKRLLGVDPADLRLDRDGSTPIGASIYLLRFQWYYAGIPVERGSVFFRINGGNLIQVATERIGPIDLDPQPELSVADAWQVLRELLGFDPEKTAKYVDSGTLRVVPMTPEGVDPNHFEGAPGSGIGYALAYHLAFWIPGQVEHWEALVDAHTGEILRFVDQNRYGRIHGGAYPGDNHTGEADRPLAFADTGLVAPDDYADAGGLFPGNIADVTLQGKYTWIHDYCGDITGSTTTGDVDFGVSPVDGTDCDVPDGNTAGPGNTIAARTQFYHLTNVNIKARTYMPANSWLNTGHMNVNTNQSAYCNASSGGGTLNFYQSTSDCWNLGELPGVALHEWGHSMDDFDGSGGDSPPLETRADWTAALQTHDSCIGRGTFKSGLCSGYGDDCLSCNGIRDLDYTQLTSSTPWSAANHGTFWSCSGGSYYGPCGLEDHCESGISSQALWELVTTDLAGLPYSMSTASAWMLVDRLFYTSMPTLGDMYSCTLPSSDGCNGASLYSNLRAFDDDGDGTANGTPHAAAIYAALARHNIACGAVGDAQNQDQSTCPTLTVTTPTSAAGSNSATISWPAMGGATRYLVYRNDIGCDAGFTKVGTVDAPQTSFVDTTVVNDIEYSYRIQGATASDSCTSAMSACVSVTPQPCAGAIILDRSVYSCSDTITIGMVDSDLVGNGSHDVTVWSDSETTPETVTLIETPDSSGKFSGTVTTSSATTPGDGSVGVVDGDTITVQYSDASYCGPPQDVQRTATADCVAPQITAVGATDVTGNGASIQWSTDELATSAVTYDIVAPPVTSSAADGALVTSHDVRLSGLSECTEYVYQVSSTDAASNSATNTNGGAFFAFKTARNTEPTYDSTDTPVDILDLATATSVLTLTDTKLVQDVNVTVNISHTYDGDMELSLIGPNGVEVMLSDNRGGGGDNFVDTVFDDEALTPITGGAAPFTGSFQPEAPLSVFDGIPGGGTWTLKVYDSGSGDVGTIDSWSLTLMYPAEICPTSDGWIDLDNAVYGCSATMGIVAQDVDLLGQGTLDVTVASDTETSPETVTLAEDPPGSGIFTGFFPTTGAPATGGDGHLSLSTGDTITATYIDADDGQGGTNIARTDVATADCIGPVISNVEATMPSGTTAEITWTTSEDSDSTVTYEQQMPPAANSAHEDVLTTNHSVLLQNLTPCSMYYFYVESTDVNANTGMDDSGGFFYRLSTPQDNTPQITSTHGPLDIPDATPTGVESVLDVTLDEEVLDVDVVLNITHTYDGDLDIYLVGPDGTTVELSTDNGSAGDNFVNTVLDDEAATPITSGAAPFTGSFQPEQALSAFDAQSSLGSWTLRVIDDANRDIGTLDSWALRFTFAPTGCASDIFTDGFESGSTSAWSTTNPQLP